MTQQQYDQTRLQLKFVQNLQNEAYRILASYDLEVPDGIDLEGLEEHIAGINEEIDDIIEVLDGEIEVKFLEDLWED